MFCYLAKVETHEESAFILRNTASKCPNVRNADVDVRSPHVDIGSADFYIAGVLRACVVSDDPRMPGPGVRVLTRMLALSLV